ncbi:TPA: hypothetical protein P8734_005698 [Pseudomonas aeruginosa]|nr:hypothetical protein [Pseudomonas aeruginosa]
MLIPIQSRKQALLFIVGVVALIGFVVVPIAKGIVERGEPLTAAEIKAAVGDSPCRKKVVQTMIDRGQIVTRGDVDNMAAGCGILDEQRSALTN